MDLRKAESSAKLSPLRVNPNAVFLNIPYDEDFRPLYLAYIVGLCMMDMKPWIASGVPGGRRRLSRILELNAAAIPFMISPVSSLAHLVLGLRDSICPWSWG